MDVGSTGSVRLGRGREPGSISDLSRFICLLSHLANDHLLIDLVSKGFYGFIVSEYTTDPKLP